MENRTIKFRGWNKTTKTMLDLKAITPLALDNNLTQDGVFIPFCEHVELMEFTGLLDKNGKEIFEGDVIRVIPKDQPPFVGHIEYDSNIARFLLKESDCGWGLYSGDSLNEIIGNIYQNPELISLNKEKN